MNMKLLKQLAIVLPPGLLAALELFHAHGHHDAVYETLSPQVGRWMVVHYLQLFLFPLTAYSVLQLTTNYRDWISRVAGAALMVYGIGYAAYDSIAGIGTGVLVSDAMEFASILGDRTPADFHPIINETIQSYYHSPMVGRIVITSVVAAIVGFLLTGIRLLPRHGIFPLLMLIAASLGVTRTHAPPYGPITYACVFAACVFVVFFSGRKDDVIAES